MNEICPAIETWETGNRWLEEERSSAAKQQMRETRDKNGQEAKGAESRDAAGWWAWKSEAKGRKRRAHPRIFRLYHTMAPTTSNASSSSRSNGTTMEAASAGRRRKRSVSVQGDTAPPTCKKCNTDARRILTAGANVAER